jgi:hypothetical protein
VLGDTTGQMEQDLTDQANNTVVLRAAPTRALILVVALLGLAALLLGLAAPATASAAGPTIAAGPSPMLGVNTGLLFNSRRYSRAQIDAQLTALARTGATTVRSDALWETAEPSPPAFTVQVSPPFVGTMHRYDWRANDLVAGSLAEHGLRWLPIIDYSAPWAESVRGDDHSAPSSVGDYASYAAAVAARYGPGGTFWQQNPKLAPLPVETYEIWNEPDSRDFWRPAPDAAAYARLYSTARAAITTVEPSAHVIVGGLTNPAWFVPALTSADPGIRDQLDGVAIHPYGPTPEDVLSNVRSARLAMRVAGLAIVPLYVTEFGWPTHPATTWDWASAQARPGYIQRTFTGLARTDCGIAGVLMYAWVTPQRDPSNREDWYGISPPGGRATLDTIAFAAGLHDAAAPGPVNPLCSGADPARGAHPASRKRSHRHKHHRRRHRPAKGRRARR